MTSDLDWKTIPKQALVTALRNANLGPTTLSSQDKATLVQIAERALKTTDAPRRQALIDGIATEAAYERGRRARKCAHDG